MGKQWRPKSKGIRRWLINSRERAEGSLFVTGNSPTTGGSWQLSTQGMEARIHSVVNLMFDRKRNKEEQRGFDF
ncbi:unnamed protein product [Lactuca virosa]|uniref:Uncharacterized protein n=1 Tax=Lactuca virosa TaxID=75947 RepID=A0AAU9LIZ0_9ASTR|nr:unnamed protein product [Lactuca virosa]